MGFPWEWFFEGKRHPRPAKPILERPKKITAVAYSGRIVAVDSQVEWLTNPDCTAGGLCIYRGTEDPDAGTYGIHMSLQKWQCDYAWYTGWRYTYAGYVAVNIEIPKAAEIIVKTCTTWPRNHPVIYILSDSGHLIKSWRPCDEAQTRISPAWWCEGRDVLSPGLYHIVLIDPYHYDVVGTEVLTTGRLVKASAKDVACNIARAGITPIKTIELKMETDSSTYWWENIDRIEVNQSACF